MTVTIGWNLIPLTITLIVVIGIVAAWHEDLKSPGFFTGLIGVVVTLVGGGIVGWVWLTYFLLRMWLG